MGSRLALGGKLGKAFRLSSPSLLMSVTSSAAILFTGKFHAVLGNHTLPEPAKGEVLIRAHLTAISPGTEMRCYAGTEAGSEMVPFIPGYSLVGVVEKAGPETSFRPGARVLCSGTQKSSAHLKWGGHTEWAISSESAVIPIPDKVSFEAAVLAKLAGISHHGVALSKPEKGEKVAVIGLGPIGMFSALIHHALGAQVMGIDTLPLRRQLAESLGITCYASIQEAQTAGGYSIVVDCSGVPAVLPQAVSLVRELPWDGGDHPAARMVLQGSYASEGAPLPYTPLFMKEVSLLIPRDQTNKDLLSALKMMEAGQLPAEKLLSTLQSPDRAQAVYTAIKDRTEPWMTAAFQWRK